MSYCPSMDPGRPPAMYWKRGGRGGGSGTHNLVYQNWPKSISPLVTFICSHDKTQAQGEVPKRPGWGGSRGPPMVISHSYPCQPHFPWCSMEPLPPIPNTSNSQRLHTFPTRVGTGGLNKQQQPTRNKGLSNLQNNTKKTQGPVPPTLPGTDKGQGLLKGRRGAGGQIVFAAANNNEQMIPRA